VSEEDRAAIQALVRRRGPPDMGGSAADGTADPPTEAPTERARRA
jgi:hypothetical protein